MPPAPSQARHRPLAIAIAVVLGVACGTAAKRGPGPKLAPAGSERDDGSGVLAKASAGTLRSTGTNSGSTGGATYATGAWAFGGLEYGGAVYGGGLYGNYQFTYRNVSDSDVSGYGGTYVIDETLPVGRIVGRVAWSTKPARDRVLGVGEGCEGSAAATNTPSNAVVFLRKIRRGRGYPELEGYPPRRWQVGGALQVQACHILPYVQVIGPMGGVFHATLEHEGQDNLVERVASSPLEERVGSGIALSFSARGDERVGQLRSGGPVPLANQRGAMAWVYAADHPFYVTVDSAGDFALLDVPAGSYELVAWHPPVPLEGGGLSAPLEVTRHVTVKAKKKTSAELRLPKP